MRNIVTIIFVYLSMMPAMAVKSYPSKVIVRQSDGSTLAVRIYGDEFFSYTTTIDGYIIAQKTDGFYYYADYRSGVRHISDIRVTAGTDMTKSNNIAINSYTKAVSISPEVEERLRDKGIQRFFGGDNVVSVAYSSQSSNTKSISSTNLNALILLVQFSDVKFTVSNPKEHFDDMINGDNYSENGATGSAKQYFQDNLGSAFNPSFDISDVITLSHDMAYYGANGDEEKDVRIIDFIEEACEKADRGGVNFAKYDNDHDGYVDNVFIYFAGNNEAEGGGDNSIWPHKWTIQNEKLTLDNVIIASYACASELRLGSGENLSETGENLSGIGVFCHEFGHILGLVDAYDTNYSVEGSGEGLWSRLSLMDRGCYNNDGRTPPNLTVYEKEMIFDTYESDDLPYSITDISAGNEYSIKNSSNYSEYLRLKTSVSGEYFLMEVRTSTHGSWDEFIGSETGKECGGLLIYHIDKSDNNAGMLKANVRWSNNCINAYSEHQCADLLEATSEASDVADVFFPGTYNVSGLDINSTPSFIEWSGKSLGIALKNIVYNDGQITFDVVSDSDSRLAIPSLKNIKPFQTTAFIEWNSDINVDAKWKINIVEYGENIKSSEDIISSTNSYYFTDLKPGCKYLCELCSIYGSQEGKAVSFTFTTNPITSDYPFIAGFDKSTYHYGDELILDLENLTENAKSITWYVDDVNFTGPKYQIKTSNVDIEIKVVIEYQDKSEEKIIKKIKVEAENTN